MRDELEHPSDELLLRSLDGEIEAAEDAQVRAHTSTCTPCRERLRKIERVSAAVQAHAAALGSEAVEAQRAALVAALDRPPRDRAPRKQPAQYRRLALAAAVLAAAGIWVLASRRPAVPVATAQGARADGFIALPYSDENLAPEGAVVLQVELPPTALLLAGLPLRDDSAGGRVKAEVLVGADGLARGIRFIN